MLYLKNLQPSVDDAVAQSEVRTKIDAASLTSLEKHGNEVGGHAAAHDHSANGELAGLDPHIWLDPVRYAQVAEGVGKAFEKADPKNAADYKRNTAALVKKLDALNTRVQGRAGAHEDQGLHHHPRRLRLPRRALRPDRGGHQRPRPRVRAQRGPREGP